MEASKFYPLQKKQRHVWPNNLTGDQPGVHVCMRRVKLFIKTTATSAATQRHGGFLLAAASPFVEWSLCCCWSRNSRRSSHRSPHRAAQESPLLLFHCTRALFDIFGTKDVHGLPPPPPHCPGAVRRTLVSLWPVCVCVLLGSHGKVLGSYRHRCRASILLPS